MKPPGVRGGSPKGDVEHRGGGGGRSGREAKLLEKKDILNLHKGGKQPHVSEDGSHTIEARAQTVSEVEDETLISDGAPRVRRVSAMVFI
jgi:hypothetical protein